VRILIAEDDRDIADLLAHYLRKSGWTAHVARAGDEALAYARANPVDLVLLDIMLPGLSGIDVCRALRADRATAAVPIIMLTARADEADRVTGLETGADDYVSKPFSPNELVARIRALMRRSQRASDRTGSLSSPILWRAGMALASPRSPKSIDCRRLGEAANSSSMAVCSRTEQASPRGGASRRGTWTRF